MTIEELVEQLRQIAQRGSVDPEGDHCDADDLLLKFIHDPRVDQAFNDIKKWYA